ncbi:MAG TPA: hypothetical protein VD913_04380 [bacterium]|nr:hypothetical protein [bacterium]
MDCCFSFEAERETCQLRFRENFPVIAPSADASFIDKALFNLTPFQYEPAEQGSPPKWRDPVPDYFPKNPLYLTLEVLRF